MNPLTPTPSGQPRHYSDCRAFFRFLSLSVATTATVLLTSSCEKEPEAWVPPTPPAAPGAATSPSAAPSPAADASAPPAADTFQDAARKHFDATAFRKKRVLQEKQWAEVQARKKTARKQSAQEMMKETNDAFVATRQLEEKITSLRAQWEAGEWAGYPLPEKPDPAITNPPITRYDVTDEHRAAPPYLPASAHQAWEDFWRRNDARLNQLMVAHVDQMKAKTAAALAAVSAGSSDETADARKARTDQVYQQGDEKTRQAKADLDAFIERSITIANAWRMKNWEGYTAPADPNAPPPETAGIQ